MLIIQIALGVALGIFLGWILISNWRVILYWGVKGVLAILLLSAIILSCYYIYEYWSLILPFIPVFIVVAGTVIFYISNE